MELFQKAVRLNPNNAANIKQVARSLYVASFPGSQAPRVEPGNEANCTSLTTLELINVCCRTGIAPMLNLTSNTI